MVLTLAAQGQGDSLPPVQGNDLLAQTIHLPAAFLPNQSLVTRASGDRGLPRVRPAHCRHLLGKCHSNVCSYPQCLVRDLSECLGNYHMTQLDTEPAPELGGGWWEGSGDMEEAVHDSEQHACGDAGP